MTRLAIVLIVAFVLSGCQSYLNMRFPPGEMASDGKVYPCNDRRRNPQACGEALYNAPRVFKLSAGQSIDEAREIMGRAPENRLIRTENGQTVEIWHYLTNYDNSVTSGITFTNGKITAITASRR